MRDVEVLTEMYHEELRRTPTGRDPVIAKIHGALGHRGSHARPGYQPLFERDGLRHARRTGSGRRTRNVTKTYHASTYFLTSLTNLLGSRFTATHMAFGAIHEMSTGQAYRKMQEIAPHPVLSKILAAIIKEGSRTHPFLTDSVAAHRARQK
jgi:hypothetical protein